MALDTAITYQQRQAGLALARRQSLVHNPLASRKHNINSSDCSSLLRLEAQEDFGATGGLLETMYTAEGVHTSAQGALAVAQCSSANATLR